MKNIKQTFIEFFNNEDMRKEITEMIKPIRESVYNEIYIYIWFICIYNVFLLFIIIANLILLLKILQKTRYMGLPFSH